jgi:hypothetical protein
MVELNLKYFLHHFYSYEVRILIKPVEDHYQSITSTPFQNAT